MSKYKIIDKIEKWKNDILETNSAPYIDDVDIDEVIEFIERLGKELETTMIIANSRLKQISFLETELSKLNELLKLYQIHDEIMKQESLLYLLYSQDELENIKRQVKENKK